MNWELLINGMLVGISFQLLLVVINSDSIIKINDINVIKTPLARVLTCIALVFIMVSDALMFLK